MNTIPATTPTLGLPTLRKDHYGHWRAGHTFPLGADLYLAISTFRVSSGSYVTTASVSKREGAFDVHRVHQDYNRRLNLSKFRGTEKNVSEHHIFSINDFGLENIFAEARCHHREELSREAPA